LRRKAPRSHLDTVRPALRRGGYRPRGRRAIRSAAAFARGEWTRAPVVPRRL